MKSVALNKLLDDEETVLLMTYAVVMLEECLMVHQDDYRDAFVRLHYLVKTEVVVVVVVDLIEVLAYVDC